MHVIHLGRFGLVANFRWFEVLNFIVGWTTINLTQDDGKKFGHWIWLPERNPAFKPPCTVAPAGK